MKDNKLLQVELFVFINWLSLIFFSVLQSFLELGPLSHLALRIGLLANIPIALCYGMFVLKYRPPVGKRLLAWVDPGEKQTLIREI
ncbi:MAG: hypothetical protein KC422_08055 [Trueperaceae bacterium]|nr:hypothetical protein [Trueperaceae bacterium]